MVLKARIGKAWEKYLEKTSQEEAYPLCVSGQEIEKLEPTSNQNSKPSNQKASKISIEDRAKQYSSQQPSFSINQLIVPDSVIDELKLAIKIVELEHKVFDEWGLRKIQPFPYSALNFYGKPGTGKSMAAHALASYLNRNILSASYAQIESMFHGEGPKNVEALFYAAERDKSILFIDESDSLLSKRLTDVTQGSEQAINSMRSQLLICLERFRGIVIFATNLIKNYDPAFETRVRNIYFPMPDYNCRKLIWAEHLVKELPLKNDVSSYKLAEIDDVCGRDIRNAVVDAALKVAMKNASMIEIQDFKDAIEKIKKRRVKLDYPQENIIKLNKKEQEIVEQTINESEN